MVKTYKYLSVAAGGTPQPLVGTTASAAVAASATPVSIPVADSSLFEAGAWAVLDKGAIEERVFINSIPDGTHINVASVAAAHLSGVYVRPSKALNSLYVQTKDGNAGAIFVGNRQDMVKATGVGVITKLTQVALNAQPTELGQSIQGAVNATDLAQYWVDGTTSDSYLPTAVVI